MRLISLILVLTIFSAKAFSQDKKKIPAGQYPFENYKAVKYKSYNNWETVDTINPEKKIHSTITIPGVFDNDDLMSIQLTSYRDHMWKNSVIQLFRKNTPIQNMVEDVAFDPIALDSVYVADINGDGLKDIKLIVAYMGNGTASLNVEIFYFFQLPNHNFNLISFSDKMSGNRLERDFDGDGNFEIITMNLMGYGDHNYWLFNLFKYKNEQLVSVNAKYNYPIMIQFLNRENYTITDKVSRKKMKSFVLTLPEGYDQRK